MVIPNNCLGHIAVKSKVLNTDLCVEGARYKDLIVRNMRQIECTHLIEIYIKLTDEKPCRMSHSERQKVRKKPGDVRMCADYRFLNRL